MIEELSATADLEDSRSFSGAAMAKIVAVSER